MADPSSEQDVKSEIDEQVRLMFRQGQYADAVPFIRQHLMAHAEDVAAYELMADALRYSGDKPSAAGALATASELYAKKGMTIQSIACQKRVVKLGVDPDYSMVRAASTPERLPTPLFDDLSDAELADLSGHLEDRAYEPGEPVVEEGAPGDSMFVIVSGMMEVFTRSGDGEVKLADLGPGDFFGEAALLSGRPRTATIRARTHAECLVLGRDALGQLVAAHPRVRDVMQDFNRRRAESTIETLVRKKKDA